MNVIEKMQLNIDHLNCESYFISVLHEAHLKEFLNDFEIGNIQMQSIQLLADKSDRFNNYESSSLRVEVAESIMQSSLYTIGIYLKSLRDTDSLINALKTSGVTEMYQKGRKVIEDKFWISKYLYKKTLNNKIKTKNYTYNATLSEKGIGVFFKSYDADYEAHEIPASIDYQLCNPVMELTGVEYIYKYLESLYLENEFCSYFDDVYIHYLLYGYDEGYNDLLINIFEYVLTQGIGCVLVNRKIVELNISIEEIRYLYGKLSKEEEQKVSQRISNAAKQVICELKITNTFIKKYIDKSISKIISNIINALETNTLEKVFIVPVNPDLKEKVMFSSEATMYDEDYRQFINELLECRYASDKLALIKEKIKSFDDFESLLLDVPLNRSEVFSVLDILDDVEIASLIKRNLMESAIQAFDITESEGVLRKNLKKYIESLVLDRLERILEIVDKLKNMTN